MELKKTNINGLYIVKNKVYKDNRGTFQKIFNFDFFNENSLDSNFKEFYFSESQKDTIRGLHFQIPPTEHVKVVYVSKGGITDVVVDLRRKSTTYGKIFTADIDSEKGEFLYLPAGVAHGFKSNQDGTIVNYAQTTCYSPDHDKGILYDSIDYDWKCDKPIVSKRDLSFPSFEDFKERCPF